MYKNFIIATLFAVAASKKKNKGKRAAVDFLKEVEDVSGMDLPACDEECRVGYVLDTNTCECNAVATAPAICHDDETFAAETCQCTHVVNQPRDPRCYYDYRLNTTSCECEAPVECNVDDDSCVEGQWFDEWACLCMDYPTCVPCGLGFKQDPKTCECIDMTVADLKCKKGQVFDQASCSCTKTEDDGEVEYDDVKCPKGYDLNADCTACTVSDFYMCKPQKCPYGMGWDSLNCICDTYPECPVGTVTECEDDYEFNKMTCVCEPERKRDKDKKGKKPDAEKYSKYSYDDFKSDEDCDPEVDADCVPSDDSGDDCNPEADPDCVPSGGDCNPEADPDCVPSGDDCDPAYPNCVPEDD